MDAFEIVDLIGSFLMFVLSIVLIGVIANGFGNEYKSLKAAMIIGITAMTLSFLSLFLFMTFNKLI